MKYTGIRSALCVALLLTFSASAVAPVPAVAADAKSPSAVRRDVPTAVKSDRMQYDAKGQVVVFEGAVYVQRPDFEMWAERITLHLKKKSAKPGKADTAGDAAQGQSVQAGQSGQPGISGMDAGEIDRIVAERNVRMKRENRTGECEKATYTVDNAVMVMEGNPVLHEGDNSIKGEVITFYTRENRSEVRGSGAKRVQAVFTSSGDVNPLGESKDNGKDDGKDAAKPSGAAQ
ncbi:MAG TPA: organic solvent tolerance protein OstA [Desulfovibrio sp.]|jgi:lipopolysaccharide export system protein LptA|nr:organic solvent tolerance protein OstA [Desulfovibrio sp.]